MERTYCIFKSLVYFAQIRVSLEQISTHGWIRVSQSCTIDILGSVIPYCDNRPIHYRIVSSIPILYPLVASSTFLPQESCDNQKCFQVDISKYPWGTKMPPVKNFGGTFLDNRFRYTDIGR